MVGEAWRERWYLSKDLWKGRSRLILGSTIVGFTQLTSAISPLERVPKDHPTAHLSIPLTAGNLHGLCFYALRDTPAAISQGDISQAWHCWVSAVPSEAKLSTMGIVAENQGSTWTWDHPGLSTPPAFLLPLFLFDK